MSLAVMFLVLAVASLSLIVADMAYLRTISMVQAAVFLNGVVLVLAAARGLRLL